MSLISPGGENLLEFLKLWQVISSYDGASGTRSGGLRNGQSPCELLVALSVSSLVEARGKTLCGFRTGT